MEYVLNGCRHCGKVNYEVELGLSKGSSKCECSFHQTRVWRKVEEFVIL